MEDEFSLNKMLPIAVEVEAGEMYRWCGCGQSQTHPFCDRHDCGDQCVIYQAQLTETVYFCNCKETRDPPLCDGSHAKVLRAYLEEKKKKE